LRSFILNSPLIPSLSLQIIKMDLISEYFSDICKAFSISPGRKTTFPMAVARASAKRTSLHIIITASAFPKLREGPTVPDEVHIPSLPVPSGISRPILPERGDSPANTESTSFLLSIAKISPPFSITSSFNGKFRSKGFLLCRKLMPFL